MLLKYKRFTPKPRKQASEARNIAYKGALLPGVGMIPPPAGKLSERKLAMALLETTYMDLQRPARWRYWDGAMDFINGAYRGELAMYRWMCATLNLDEQWLRAQLKRVAIWPLARPPESERALRWKRRLH